MFKRNLISAFATGLICASSLVPAQPAWSTICFVNDTASVRNVEKHQKTAQDVATDLGVQLQTFTSTGSISSSAEMIGMCADTGAKVIMFNGFDDGSISTMLRNAKSANSIFVIAMGSALMSPEVADLTLVENDYRSGILLGEWAKEAGATEAGLIVSSESPSNWELLRHQGFLSGLGRDVGRLTTLEDGDQHGTSFQTAGGFDVSSGIAGAETLLQSDPDIDVIFAPIPQLAEGVSEYFGNYGTGKTIQVLVPNGGCSSLEGVASGEISATTVFDDSELSIFAVRAASEYLRTGQLPEIKDDCEAIGIGPLQVPADPCCEDPDSCMPGFVHFDSNLVVKEPVPGLTALRVDDVLGQCR